jgi:hypothetical protein
LPESDIILYPNPATDNLTIESPQKATIEIFNIQGQLLKSTVAGNNKTMIGISAFQSGMYLVKVKTDHGVAVKKFIKQ